MGTIKNRVLFLLQVRRIYANRRLNGEGWSFLRHGGRAIVSLFEMTIF